ncbi:MAG TPA: hypothetical protein DCM28_18450, partial [Phycisphaerales bacterium]|nr:hypothetical protein [Phycisphaerales bacterium]
GHSPVDRGDVYAADTSARKPRDADRHSRGRVPWGFRNFPGFRGGRTGLLQFTGEWPALLKVL